MKSIATIFFTVLLAEIGDKTQLATLLFATESNISRVSVFAAAAAALVTSTALAVFVGNFITRVVPISTVKTAAGIGFIIVGIWTLFAKS